MFDESPLFTEEFGSASLAPAASLFGLQMRRADAIAAESRRRSRLREPAAEVSTPPTFGWGAPQRTIFPG